MEVTKVQKKLIITRFNSIKYQLITELVLFRNEHLIPSDIDILTLLAMWGTSDLSSFCSAAALNLRNDIKPQEYSVRSQNIRNRLVKLEKRGFVVKSSAGKKTISLNENIETYSSGNILLNYNFLTFESNKS